MSRYHVPVPVPDYDFTIRQKNPYIPMPDYTTIKSNKNKNRPSLNAIGLQFDVASSPLRVETHYTNGEESARQQHAVPSLTSQRKLRFPDINSNFDEIKKHSYIEDREEEDDDHHRTTKEHIKHIGVPVIPGINRSPISSLDMAVAPVSSDQNKAYLRHLENHKKFDTVRGDRGIDHCEICQIMKKQNQAEYEQSHHNVRPFYEYNAYSSPAVKRRHTDIRSVFPEPDFIRTRAKFDYERKHKEEMSVNCMEILDIIDIKSGFALCQKLDNEIGWIPTEIIDI